MNNAGPFLVLNGPCRGQKFRPTFGDTLVVAVGHLGEGTLRSFSYKLIGYSTGSKTHYFWVNPTTPVGSSQILELILDVITELGDTIRPTNRRIDE